MRLLGNALNGCYVRSIIEWADRDELEQIQLAVAFVTFLDPIYELATKRNVPLKLYALGDGCSFPTLPILKRMVESSRPSWQLFLTRDYYHPKILWFRGVGAYIGSANLTQNGWNANLECGVWFSQEDLDEVNWSDELTRMFQVIASRSTPATQEHVRVYADLSTRTRQLERERQDLKALADGALQSVRGADKPIDPTGRSDGGAARVAFLQDWQQSLTLLRKLADMVRDVKWPPWVDSTVHPVVAQDQATEYWYDTTIRRSGDSLALIEKLHDENRRDPDQAVRRIFEEWSRFEGSEQWRYWVNDAPRELSRRLSRPALEELDVDGLAWILEHTHAAREHGRQIKKLDLGLASTESASKAQRARLFAEYLWNQRSGRARTVKDVLVYVLWGDKELTSCPERIWNAAHLEAWKIPHLGENILGEMVGYARPDEFPPRNGRVSKSLRALGYDGVTP